jgi:hypothetical protein
LGHSSPSLILGGAISLQIHCSFVL